jgi:hypothetical protein
MFLFTARLARHSLSLSERTRDLAFVAGIILIHLAQDLIKYSFTQKNQRILSFISWSIKPAISSY